MRIIQLLPTLSYGDAVGNDALAIKSLIHDMGHQTQIYAQRIDSRLPRRTAISIDRIPKLGNRDILLYHASTGTELNFLLPRMGGQKVMRYHNVTPPTYFREYDTISEQLCTEGYRGMRHLSDRIDYCIADSEYNRENLLDMGYTCPIEVCPILIPFSDYEKTPSNAVIKRYCDDGYTNIVFVGRVAPNKKHENIIRAFYCYQKYFNQKARLFLVGSFGDSDRYYQRLYDYVQVLGLEGKVIFTGHIKFNEILAYYRIADVFLCMSEHEGFCVPLVESMHFGVPIVAYNTTAIPYTLGGSGVLLETAEPIAAAEAIARIIDDKNYRNDIVAKQYERVQDFSHEDTAAKLKEILQRIMEGR